MDNNNYFDKCVAFGKWDLSIEKQNLCDTFRR